MKSPDGKRGIARKAAPYLLVSALAFTAGKGSDILPSSPSTPKTPSVEYSPLKGLVFNVSTDKQGTINYTAIKSPKIKISEDGHGGLIATKVPNGNRVEELTIHFGDASQRNAVDHDGNTVFFPSSGEMNIIPSDGKIGLQVSHDASGHRVEQELYVTTVPPHQSR